MSRLRKKFPEKDYNHDLSRVIAEIKDRREGRRVKRRLEAVSAPEKWGRDKVRKGERKKIRRKEKSADFQGRRRGW